MMEQMQFGQMPFGQMQFGKQMMDGYKAMFDNTYNAMVMMQDQNENMVKMFLDQATWLPEQGKQPITDWIKAAKKGRDDFKKAIDDNFKKMGGVFGAAEKAKPAAQKKTQK